MRTLRIAFNLIVCLWLCAPSLGMAENLATQPTRVIQDNERMLLDGRDIFSYHSGELYTLLLQQNPQPQIGYWGYAGEEGEVIASMGLHLPFEGFQVLTLSNSPETLARRDELLALPPEQTNYPIRRISIDNPGVAGPFGVMPGMKVGELQASLPEGVAKTPVPDGENGGGTFILRYVDANAQSSAVYTLTAYLLHDGAVKYVEVLKDQEMER